MKQPQSRIVRQDLKQRLHILDGLDRAPTGLRMLFEGGNTGKLAVRVAE